MRRALLSTLIVAIACVPLGCSDDPSGPKPDPTSPVDVWGGEVSGSDVGYLRRIALAPDGTFYLIGGKVGTSLYHVDDQARFIDEWNSAGPHTFGTLGDVVVASDGTVFVSDTGNSLIYKLSADGQLLRSWDGTAAAGSDAAESAAAPNSATQTALNSPRGIALRGGVELYVVDSDNDLVQIYATADGSFINAWPIPLAGTGNYDVPTAITVDGSEVYVVSEPSSGNYASSDSQVQVFTTDGFVARRFGPFGSNDNANEIFKPLSVDIGPDNNVYLMENNAIGPKLMTKQGVFAGRLATSGGLYHPSFQSASDMAIDPATGTVYAADGFLQTVQAIRGVNDVAFRVVAPLKDGEFGFPYEVVVGGDGNVYTAGFGRGVQVFSPTGEFIRNFLPYVGPQVELGVDQAGNVYLFYYVIGVHVFDPNGDEIDFWTTSPLFGHFKMAVSLGGTVYIPLVDRIRSYTKTGAFVQEFPIGAQAGTPSIVDLSVDARGDIFVLTTDDVRQFNPDGTPVRTWAAEMVGPGGFVDATALAGDSFGYVFVADAAVGEVYVFAPDGTFAGRFGSSPGGLTQNTVGLAADPVGRVFLADGNNQRVIRFFWEFLLE